MWISPPANVTELRARRQEPHRRHHDHTHLEEMRAALQTLRAAGLEFDSRPVTLAAWFHDAVYRPFRSDNQRASADSAPRLLTGDPDRAEVARLVELTATHDPATATGPPCRTPIRPCSARARSATTPMRRTCGRLSGVPRPTYRRRLRAQSSQILAPELAALT